MNIRDLIEKLQGFDEELEVYLGCVDGYSYEKVSKLSIDSDGDLNIE